MTAFLTVRAPLLSSTVHILYCKLVAFVNFIKENDDDDDNGLRHVACITLAADRGTCEGQDTRISRSV